MCVASGAGEADAVRRPDRLLCARACHLTVLTRADALTREQLKGHSPLAKFLTIKVRITAGATAEPRS